MIGNFKKCLEVILKHEGGYVNNPKDPGGATNYGITKATYEDFYGVHVSVEDIKNMDKHSAVLIYEVQYWDKIRGDDLHSGLDLAVFDWAVNSGVGRAVKKLQEMVGATVDGQIGSKTIQAVGLYVTRYGIDNVIKEYMDMRQEYYEKLKGFDTFGRGWTRRQEETRRIALEMV